MDVFSTVASAIELAEKIWKTIDNFQKVPERLRRLHFDVRSLQKTLEKLKETEFQGKNDDGSLETEVQEIEKSLLSLQRIISQQQQKSGSSVLSRSLRTFRTQLKFDDLDELSGELQKRKASLSLMINMLVLSSVGKVDTSNQQPNVSTAVDTEGKNHTTAIPVILITRKEFLDGLKAPNYVEDDLRVRHPTDGTATWIYDHEDYQDWCHGSESRTLHLVGKMGSGKSVLTKGVIKTLKQMALKTDDQGCMVLYYYCTCVNRVDTATDILKGFLAQFVSGRADIYDEALSGIELLQSRKSGETIGWSFEALWLIFTRLIQFSGLSTLYCVVDALDECADSNSLHELLSLLDQLTKDKLPTQMRIKLFFSSREYTKIMHSLDCHTLISRVFVQPETVVSDIRLAMQNDIASIQRRLKLQEDEVEVLQEALLEKADGMFLWVAMATKSIEENSYDATFEALEELIDDLPIGLKGLYEKNWVKLVDSLPTAKFALANKILNWVLLAERPLSLSELTMALAIEPGQKKIPPPKKLLRNLSGFILNYLAPFVEVITANEVPERVVNAKNASTETLLEPPPPPYTPSVLAYQALDSSKVRLVHQSVQEYLLEACNENTSATPVFEINLRKGHEYLARVCMTYLSADELQLGWIDEENRNEWGVQITTDATRDKVQGRLNTHHFLAYAGKSWGFHVLKCQQLPSLGDDDESSKSHDVFQAVIHHLKNFRQGYACGAQARQLLMGWDEEIHCGPAPPLHNVAAKDLTIVVKRLLLDPELDLDERDSEGCTALHYPTQGEESVDYPERRLEVVQLLLKAGFDVNAITLRGETPLHTATGSSPFPSMVKILLDAGADPLIKDGEGFTALNNRTAVASKEIVEMLSDAGADINSIDDDGLTPILYASQVKSWDTIRILADRGADVGAQNKNGWSCLHYVAEQGQTELMRHLLKEGAKTNVKTNSDWTPLHSAVRFDQLECYKVMVEQGFDTEVADEDGCTVLHVAAEYGSLEFVRFLVQSGHDVNVKTEKESTPLNVAAWRGSGPVAEFLLNNEADPVARDADGFTPLHTACDFASTEVCRLLLPFYEDVDCLSHKGSTPLSLACSNPASDPKLIEMLIAKGANPNSEHGDSGLGDSGLTAPLHCAASCGFAEAVEILLRNGAEIEKKAIRHVQPLDRATENHLEDAKLPHEKGAQIDAGKGNLRGFFTALEITFFHGHVELAKWLLDKGADPSALAFTLVIRDAPPLPGHFEILNLILQKLGDVDALDTYKLSALEAAVTLDRLDLAKFLLDLGANRTQLTSRGDSVFHLATVHNNVEMLKVLTKGRPASEFLSLLDFYGLTPPQVASLCGNLEALQYFAEISPAEALRISIPRNFLQILMNSNAMDIFAELSRHGVLDLNLPYQSFLDTVLYTLCYPGDRIRVGLENTLEQLIKFGLDVNIVDYAGETILHRLAISCRPGVAKILIAHGAELKQRDGAGRSAFDRIAMVAAQIRKSEATSPSDSASSTSSRSSSSYAPSPPPEPAELPPPPPHSAVFEKPTESPDQAPVKFSLSQSSISEFKSPVETATEAFVEDAEGRLLKDDTGGTMLHVAASHGDIELVTAIIDKNPLMIADDNGWTPVMFAERGGFADVVTLLSKLGTTADESKLPTRIPSRWSSRFRGAELILSEADSIVELPATVDCSNVITTSPQGRQAVKTLKAFSILADAPVPTKQSTIISRLKS